MRTVGIDLAAQPANTGWCVVDWAAHRVVEVSVNHSGPEVGGDEELVSLVCSAGVGLAGIDTPLGWPDGFVEAIAAHHAGDRWPDDEGDPDGHRRRLRLRRTDALVGVATGRHPMSVSADRIAVAAMRGARLQQLIKERAGRDAVDRSGCSGLVAETYPAAALAVWGLAASGYKGTGGTSARAELVDALVGRSGLVVTDDQRAAMVGSDHLLDAWVCALVARAVLDGGTTRPGPGDEAVARREGWIHVPDAGWRGGGRRSSPGR